MKVTENLRNEAREEILSSINEKLDRSHYAKQWWEIEVVRRSDAWLLEYEN